MVKYILSGAISSLPANAACMHGRWSHKKDCTHNWDESGVCFVLRDLLLWGRNANQTTKACPSSKFLW